MKAALTKLIMVCIALFIAALTCGISGPAGKAGVLIIQDERPQMDVLAKFLEEKGKLPVTIVDQQNRPKELSSYKAVIVFIHKELAEQTERAIAQLKKQLEALEKRLAEIIAKIAAQPQPVMPSVTQ